MPQRRAVLLLLLCAAAGAGCRAHPGARPAPANDPQVVDGLARLRAATLQFKNLDAAVAAGYARNVPDCLVHEHHGAMGYHHLNRALADAKADVEHPEILLYERLPDGEYRLNGVEFIVPYRAWPRDSTPPVLMGRQLKHEDNLNLWYMHVWAWTDNADGLFADFNPAVQCPDSARKVFTPFARP